MYAICFGCCCNCGQPFAFNPMRVPSIIIDGTREPVCRDCMDAVNAERKQLNMPLIPVAADAYDSCSAEEL